ncbi:maleylpyruvate isomerase N-terminal domain-containing protein [Micropruina sonneratiae]|uniref:maleylpyruvate isomerase N-terminal domain-containing protein n=1 Tax=Micropruina sonneratiae TaxID=2986940 RepID=UPI002227EC75|nr:maleylpyruvate isomerase N-terminal domain-containing protein [Micropruina sp. KQZ13P-5]MCW3156528.1 maleylpyruvate isomerase N-terminal domain-containing protein [Micropruina sp. KQZ13P-5]
MIDHSALILSETERFADVLAAADPSAPVPTCPEWKVADLLWHLTEVHAFWAGILASGALSDADCEAVEENQPPRPTDLDATLALLDSATVELVAQLDKRLDEQPAWSWFAADQTVGFTRRMQVHEATMHRVDAEGAAGVEITPIDPEVAADGVLHAIDVMFAWWGTLPGFEFVPAESVVALTLSDGAPGGGSRTVLVRPGRWRGVGESGTSYDEPGILRLTDLAPDAGFAGTADEVDRWLWGRGPEPEADGDPAALEAVRAVVAKGVQ